MGWMYMHKPKGFPIQKFFEEQFNYDHKDRSGKIIECKAHVFQREVYMAYELVNKQSGDRRVIGIVCRIDFRPKEYHNFGYKDMDETMGPSLYGCPKSILDKLTPTENKNALTWRKKCRENVKKKGLRTGNFIIFDKPVPFSNGEEFKVFKIANARKLWFQTQGTNGIYSMRRKYLRSLEWKQIDPNKDKKEDLLLCLALHHELDEAIGKRLRSKK